MPLGERELKSSSTPGGFPPPRKKNPAPVYRACTNKRSLKKKHMPVRDMVQEFNRRASVFNFQLDIKFDNKHSA